MGTAEPYRHAKTKENTTQQAAEAINTFRLQSKMAGMLHDLNTDFLLLQTVFLAQNLGSFSVKVYNLDSSKKPNILLCSSALKWKVIHKRTWTGKDRKLEATNPSWMLACHCPVPCMELHIHPCRKGYLFWIQTTRERIYGKTAGSWGCWLLFFCILVHPK